MIYNHAQPKKNRKKLNFLTASSVCGLICHDFLLQNGSFSGVLLSLYEHAPTALRRRYFQRAIPVGEKMGKFRIFL